MNGITQYPPKSEFGYDYDYSKVSADSEVTLLSVPWSNSYSDVVEYASDAELNAWIDRQPNTAKTTIRQMTNITPGNPIKIEMPLNTASRYNYVRVRNNLLPVPGDTKRDYFFFVLEAHKGASETTYLHLQVDVWQTYRRMVKFLRAFVEVGHLGVANSRSGEDFGRNWLSVPEGLDTGVEYQCIRTVSLKAFNNLDVLITATSSLRVPPGTVNNPTLVTSSGGYLQRLPTATNTYRVSLADFPSYMLAMSTYPWVTQGIVRVVLVPQVSDLGLKSTAIPRTNNYPPGAEGSPDSYLHTLDRVTGNAGFEVPVDFDVDDMRETMTGWLPQRFRGLDKFRTAPYMYIELSTGFGESFTYRPELFPTSTERAIFGFSLIPGCERIEFIAKTYNGRNGIDGDMYSTAVSLGNFPTLPVVNNMAISQLASTAHGRNQYRASADWSRQLAQAGADNSYSNTQQGASTAFSNEMSNQMLSADLQEMAHDTQRTNAAIGVVGQMAGGASSGAIGGYTSGGGSAGAAGGAALGAVAGTVGAATSAWQMLNNQNMERSQLQASMNTGGKIAGRNYDTTMGIAESNKGFAEYAAKGNYANAIAAQQSQVRDTMLTQPGMSGQFGGEFLRVMQKGFTFEARVKAVDQGSVRRLGEHWLRYGYRVNEFTVMPDSLLVMNKFAYWKTSETYVTEGTVPEVYKQAIRGIMERGVTVWASADMIGKTDPATNKPVAGVEIRNGA